MDKQINKGDGRNYGSAVQILYKSNIHDFIHIPFKINISMQAELHLIYWRQKIPKV
jgi:hypothetical protein